MLQTLPDFFVTVQLGKFISFTIGHFVNLESRSPRMTWCVEVGGGTRRKDNAHRVDLDEQCASPSGFRIIDNDTNKLCESSE